MQLLVLRLDYKLSTKLEQDSKDLYNASNRGKETPLPPHISLFSFDQANPVELSQRVQQWCKTQKQIDISLSSLGFFKQHGTFFAAPVVTKEVETFHRDLYSMISNLHTPEISPYLPGQWVPHVTLINHVPLTVWGPLFQRASLAFEPLAGKAVALECWTIVNNRAQTDWTYFLQ
ncbi:2'-5' RNA ligase family protein [Paenisporosarcina indica]|uniref:2'-5' RNA ligase family protein n=1 Tax=Paenisporosarcina indica TaxID=650093 RepID=UPI00094FDF14|nr:2'-5' RNA ligase family protein [Paenisporosarcina indica]